MIGETLSHFRITAKLGEGGMGEVYRADDTKLGREVAIKVLPEAVANSPERLARFEREAKVLASLNHSNIAAIYSLETAQAGAEVGHYSSDQAGTEVGHFDATASTVTFLVLELVEGEDLSQQIERGPVPMSAALHIAAQIAEALETAHDRGIIHRDLKPANVKVTTRNRVKVLDFGLAKALDVENSVTGYPTPSQELGILSPNSPSKSPTLTAEMTTPGQVLGTPAYMAPEQIRGESVDKRADIWAFGITLFEMITGQRAFAGTTTVDSMAKILEAPLDWQLLPDSTPSAVQHLLERCLDKNPYQRLRDIGEARVALQAPETAERESSGPAKEDRVSESGGSRLPWLLVAVLTLVLAATLGWVFTRPSKSRAEAVRLSVQLPEEAQFQPLERSSLAIAPDGSMFVYVGGEGPQQRLYARHLNGDTVIPIENTEGAQSPFFSPDSLWIGFYVGNEMKRISTTGGPAQTMGFAPPVTRGQEWLPDQSILLTPNKAVGLWRASVTDGRPEEIVGVGDQIQSSGYCWPDSLPNGKQALVSRLKSNATSWEDAQILLVDLESGETRELIEGGSYARLVQTGHIVFAQGGTLMAVPFDPSTGSLSGVPITVIDDVLSDPASGVSHFSISTSGTLIYARGGSRSPTMSRLAWVDRDGQAQIITPEPRPFQHPRVSPDGRYIAMTITGASDDIWTLDLQRNVFRRITFGGRNFMPVWNPNGRSVTFASIAGAGFPTIHFSPIDGSGPATPLLEPGRATIPESWSPDGQHLAFCSAGADSNWDIYLTGSDRSSTALLESRFSESSSAISPDGRWISFVSDESGESQVYVASFPDLSSRLQVSDGGGTQPVWSPDARELFFRTGSQILVVEIQDQVSLSVGIPKIVVEKASTGRSPVPGYPHYDIAPDGKRFLMMESVPMPRIDHIEVVLNWFDELERLVPTKD